MMSDQLSLTIAVTLAYRNKMTLTPGSAAKLIDRRKIDSTTER